MTNEVEGDGKAAMPIPNTQNKNKSVFQWEQVGVCVN